MTAIICFDLIPQSIGLTDLSTTIIGIILGITAMVLCDSAVKKKYEKNLKENTLLLKTGIIIGIGLAIHNFPEGLAIGSGFNASIKLGYSLAIAILLHDVPEGVTMSIPMRLGGMKKQKVLIYTILSGMTTGIGAFFGALIGNISQATISMCLAFAARCNAIYCIRGIDT